MFFVTRYARIAAVLNSLDFFFLIPVLKLYETSRKTIFKDEMSVL